MNGSAGPERSEEVFTGRLFRVVLERWGNREREIVHHPGAVAAVAITADERVVLVRQFRESVREALLEAPAGILDVEGERPEETARRELEEETGYRAGAWTRLGAVYSSPGFSDERVELYLAEGAERVGEPEEGIEVVLISLAQALDAVSTGRIVDAKTAVALLLTARRA